MIDMFTENAQQIDKIVEQENQKIVSADAPQVTHQDESADGYVDPHLLQDVDAFNDPEVTSILDKTEFVEI